MSLMMPGNDSKADMKKDDRARALENNPCSMCRAMGSPICRGHGGGGGGNGGGGSGGGSHSASNDDISSAKSILLTPGITADATSITQSLAQNKHWRLVDDTDLTFKFTAPDALLIIALDMASGALVFRGNGELSKEEQKAVDELFNAIENELTRFRSELAEKNLQIEPIKVARDHNTLSIKISDPQYYDLLIQQLIDKNLLPNKAVPLQQQHNEFKQSTPGESAEPTPEATAPTPFDTRGPRPKGWDAGRL